MTFIVGSNCVGCKDTHCVQVCPVDCFFEGPNMLVIDPDECIDCGLCEPECPVDAIFADTDVPLGQEAWAEINQRKISDSRYKNIVRVQAPMAHSSPYTAEEAIKVINEE